ncbi:hypothetical protein V7O61_15015 [Methanolobus sp. WCC1]|uniref:hypothetical protein n=1 Tax=unclassified Methanolobus TaxID=2629569 RepID=UPI003243904A
MNKSRETKKRFEEKKLYENIVALLEKQGSKQDYNNKWTRALTIISVTIAFFLLVATCLQLGINDKLTSATVQEYSYHQPDVNLVDSYFVKLYVYEINETTTKFSFLNIARVYNSAQSDDIALVKPKDIMKVEQINDFKGMSLNLMSASSGEIFGQYTIPSRVGYVTSIEGLPFPVPIIPGNAPQEIPFFRTIVSTHEANHEEFGFNLNDTLEVNHPNGSLIKEIIIPTTSNIMYTRGDENAIVKVDNNLSYAIDVRFTDNETIYDGWKTQFLLKYSSSAVTLS